MRNRVAFSALAAVFTLSSAAAQAQDLYIGTVSVEKGQVLLTRCDLARNRYSLRDRKAEREKPVAELRERLKTLKAPVYVEIFGQYAELGADNALDVIALENVTAGKSCHLTDVLPAG
jgi:hypothetical protein